MLGRKQLIKALKIHGLSLYTCLVILPSNVAEEIKTVRLSVSQFLLMYV